VHWTHPFGDKLSGEKGNTKKAAGTVSNIQTAKRVPQLRLLQFRRQKRSKQRQRMQNIKKRPNCGGIDPHPEVESWWRVPMGWHLLAR